MDLYSLIGFTAAAAVISGAVKSIEPQIGRQTAIAAAAFAMLSIIAAVSRVFDEINGIAQLGGLGTDTIGFIFKSVGIAYTARTAALICEDFEEKTLAEAAEFAGRAALLAFSAPVVRRIAEMLIELIRNTF